MKNNDNIKKNIEYFYQELNIQKNNIIDLNNKFSKINFEEIEKFIINTKEKINKFEELFNQLNKNIQKNQLSIPFLIDSAIIKNNEKLNFKENNNNFNKKIKKKYNIQNFLIIDIKNQIPSNQEIFKEINDLKIKLNYYINKKKNKIEIISKSNSLNSSKFKSPRKCSYINLGTNELINLKK